MKRLIIPALFLSFATFLHADAATKSIAATLSWSNPTTVAAGTLVVVEASNDKGVTWTPACTTAVPSAQCLDTVARPVGFTYSWRAFYRSALGDGPASDPVSFVALVPTDKIILKIDSVNVQ